MRLARLEEALGRYPRAADWEWQTEQLAVARALAGNTRAVVQFNGVADLTSAMVARDAYKSVSSVPPTDGPAASATS